MLYYIYSEKFNKAFKDRNNKIIVFNGIDKATYFAEQFIGYAMSRMMNENMFGIGEVLKLQSSISILDASSLKEEDTIKIDF